ncbi:MAG: hypothetical protein ABW215_21085 [Kibdelosporangium sp.]
MSSARQSSTGRLRLATAAVGITLAFAGCSAGQISQTAGMEPAVNGGIGQTGDIAIRDIQLGYPQDGVHKRGESAVVLGAIVNSGLKDDELVSASTPLGQVVINGDKRLPAGRMLLLDTSGAAAATATTTSTSAPSTTPPTTPSRPSGSVTTPPSGSQQPTTPTSTTAPSSPTVTATSTPTSTPTTSAKPASIGKVTVAITGLTEEVRSGQTVEITFVFRSGQVTVTVPIAVPTTPRTPAAKEGEGH